MKFCKKCGTELKATSKFCPGCGADCSADAAPAVSPEVDFEDHVPPRNPVLIAAIATGLAAVAMAGGAWYGGFFDRFKEKPAEPVVEASQQVVTDPNSRPPEWFANYRDEYLSEEVVRYTSSKTEQRNFPTVKGTMAMGTIDEGRMVTGRLVTGGDPGTRWLKTGEGSYVWTGNLAERPRFPGPSDGSVPLAVSNVRFGTTVIDNQIGDLKPNRVFIGAPATVVVQFDYENATYGQPYTCSTRGADQTVVSSFSNYFQSDKSWIWCRYTINNPGITIFWLPPMAPAIGWAR